MADWESVREEANRPKQGRLASRTPEERILRVPITGRSRGHAVQDFGVQTTLLDEAMPQVVSQVTWGGPAECVKPR